MTGWLLIDNWLTEISRWSLTDWLIVITVGPVFLCAMVVGWIIFPYIIARLLWQLIWLDVIWPKLVQQKWRKCHFELEMLSYTELDDLLTDLSKLSASCRNVPDNKYAAELAERAIACINEQNGYAGFLGEQFELPALIRVSPRKFSFGLETRSAELKDLLAELSNFVTSARNADRENAAELAERAIACIKEQNGYICFLLNQLAETESVRMMRRLPIIRHFRWLCYQGQVEQIPFGLVVRRWDTKILDTIWRGED